MIGSLKHVISRSRQLFPTLRLFIFCNVISTFNIIERRTKRGTYR
ncbi:hypothetical protein ED5_0870 [Enterobacter roggenkampii]|nr:hypothetical protein ED5_0870 [Enterobacter roggenkampii]